EGIEGAVDVAVVEALVGDDTGCHPARRVGYGGIGRERFQSVAAGVHEVLQITGVVGGAVMGVVVKARPLGFQGMQQRLVEPTAVGDGIGARLLADGVDVVEGHLGGGYRAYDDTAAGLGRERSERDGPLDALALAALGLPRE